MLRLALVFAAVLLAVPAAPVRAQDQTLADIRQELSVLFVELQRLKRELSTTGSPGVAVGGDVLQRVDLIEQELQRLTAKIEELEFRIEQVVADGTNRIGDLEFRLCELEPGCDVATLGETPRLGGTAAPEVAAPAPPPPRPSGTQQAVGEQADFDRAKEALDSGSFRTAADLFKTFTETYTGGALTGEAHFYRGEALRNMGESAPAARAYLESFSGWPGGDKAPQALYRLGLQLNALGQADEGCVMLNEVLNRYPGASAAAEARTARAELGCQ